MDNKWVIIAVIVGIVAVAAIALVFFLGGWVIQAVVPGRQLRRPLVHRHRYRVQARPSHDKATNTGHYTCHRDYLSKSVISVGLTGPMASIT